MGYIKQLPEDLIKKIAAGEVIDRPASVVKELVENSIDAHATKVEIEIQRSGKYIKVSDDGVGIDPDDLPLLFTRHATSKIQNFNDLWEINSLGFRGEALASISSISKVTCRSKHKNQDHGFEAKIIGEKIDKKSSGISIGTVFEIDDLFYNVPARQKFLKSETTELNHIYDAVVSLALSHSKVSFTLLNNKKTILKSSGSGNLKDTIIELLGNDLNNKLIPLGGKNNFLKLEGFLSSLEVCRSDRKSMFVFINERPVKCHIALKAISSAFEGLLPQGKHPVVVLNLEFKPKFVDVNVHPTKKEVRYTNPNDVYNLVLHSIQNAVSEHYKKEYKEKSIYSLESKIPNTLVQKQGPQVFENPKPSQTIEPQAFVESKKNESLPLAEDVSQTFIEKEQSSKHNLFSVNNLNCYFMYSEKPIANMTRIANKTIFEVGSIFDNDLQIVFSGEIIGDQSFQRDFFNQLSELANQVYKTQISQYDEIQQKLINIGLEEDRHKKANRKKPPLSLLYKVWERDGWTCVYCGKQLLDPSVVKETMSLAKDAFISYLNNAGKEVSEHVLREHIASYDHHLPTSKLPQFNFEEENLLACCMKCNKEKLDSMELKSWKPNKQNNWHNPLSIAGICFTSPKEFKRELKV